MNTQFMAELAESTNQRPASAHKPKTVSPSARYAIADHARVRIIRAPPSPATKRLGCTSATDPEHARLPPPFAPALPPDNPALATMGTDASQRHASLNSAAAIPVVTTSPLTSNSIPTATRRKQSHPRPQPRIPAKPLSKRLAFRFRMRRGCYSVAFCSSVMTVLLFLAWTLNATASVVNMLITPVTTDFNPYTAKQRSTTRIGTPLLPLPPPYGTSASTMASVLRCVRQYLRGGSRLDPHELAASIDEYHLHGAHIGHVPKTHTPLWLPTFFDFSTETTEMKRKAHEKACFNKVRSNSLALDRLIPDVRPPTCTDQWYYHVPSPSPLPPTGLNKRGSMYSRLSHVHLTYPNLISSLSSLSSSLSSAYASQEPPKSSDSHGRLPTMSVIIIFVNEPLSTLLRSVYSVLNRTPRHLLHEIILVDDGSDSEAPWLAENGELEKHLQYLPKAFLTRLSGRNGLMRARNVGASMATGDVLMFLDSHIEATVGWAEPLLGRIVEGQNEGIERVVVPAIDNIKADTFNFVKGGIDILGHTWGLSQVGIPNLYNPNSSDPMLTPIMAGGLLAISRTFFNKLGMYDPEMQLWGGEEMEISFRIWLCGGALECMPCSRVGHVFRSSEFWQGQVYKVPPNTVTRNKHRAAFWMGEYAELAHLSLPPLPKNMSIGSMQFYHDVQLRMKCKPFQYYVDNVNKQLHDSAKMLLGDAFGSNESSSSSSPARLGGASGLFSAKGYLRNVATNTCIDHLHLRHAGMPFGVYPCHFQSGSQSAVLSQSGLLMSGERLTEGCLTREPDDKLKQHPCSEHRSRDQIWGMTNYSLPKSSVYITGNDMCLTVVNVPDDMRKSPFSLIMKPCGGEYLQVQEWQWESAVQQRSRDEARKKERRFWV